MRHTYTGLGEPFIILPNTRVEVAVRTQLDLVHLGTGNSGLVIWFKTSDNKDKVILQCSVNSGVALNYMILDIFNNN